MCAATRRLPACSSRRPSRTRPATRSTCPRCRPRSRAAWRRSMKRTSRHERNRPRQAALACAGRLGSKKHPSSKEGPYREPLRSAASAHHGDAQPRRRHEPQRLRVRPAAPGADHLPRPAGRRRDRQPDLRTAAAARCRGPQARRQPVHQLAGWLGDGRHGHFRHHGTNRVRCRHLGAGARGVDGPVPALGGHPRQALCAAARADPDAPGLGRPRWYRVGHQDPGRAVEPQQAGARGDHRRAHRKERRADHCRRRPRPLVHRSGSRGVWIRRPHRVPRQPGPRRRQPGGMRVNEMSELINPSARYVLPSFVERTNYGIKESNPYNKLFEERIIFLGAPIDDVVANDVMAQLIVLESTDPDRDIQIYINSPGGSFTALTAIYDTMVYVRPEIQTICMGQAASAAAVLLAAGTKGKRFALSNSRILIHQPSGGTEGPMQISDLDIQAREIQRMRELMEEILARHTGQTIETVRADIERDKIFTAEQAKEYGMVDEVITTRKLTN